MWGGRWRVLVQFISDLPNQLREETRLREYSSSIKNTQFCATVPGFQPSLKRLIVQQPKDKGSSPSARREQCVEVWVVMQITNCTGHRGKREGNGSLSARHAEGGEGRTGVSLPPFSLSLSLPLFLLLFHSLYPKLAAGRQMNAVWSEPTEVQGPAVQATKELHARHLLFSYQNTFSHVPPFPRSFSIPLPPRPRNIHSVNWEPSLFFFFSPHSSPTAFFFRSLLRRHSPPIPFSFSHLPP